MNESGKQVEFTPTELKWWTFKFILSNPKWTFYETRLGSWWKGLGNDR